MLPFRCFTFFSFFIISSGWQLVLSEFLKLCWCCLILSIVVLTWYWLSATIILFVLLFLSEVKLEEAAVLHYTYAKFSDLTSRRDRCGCKPTKEDVKRCFMLEFDRAVSAVLSLGFHFSCCCLSITSGKCNLFFEEPMLENRQFLAGIYGMILVQWNIYSFFPFLIPYLFSKTRKEH